MRPLIHRLVLAALVAGGLLLPTAASAVTVDEIVALAHAGVTDAVILALIDRDKTIFALEPEQLVTLQSEGVSEPVLLAMLRSGREEGDRAARAESDLKTAMYLAERSPGPEVVIIGHGPEPPNVARPNGFYSSPPAGGYFPVPYIVGSGGRRARGRSTAPSFTPFTATSYVSPFHEPAVPPTYIPVIPPVALTNPAPVPRMLCRADISSASSSRPLTTIVACPPGGRR